MAEIKKVVLAYSGGLDTSIIIPWLKENYGCEVIAVAGNVGQGDELDGLEAKVMATGASKLYVEDLRRTFVEDYIWPTLKAGAKYETYLLGTSFARPVIAKRIVEIALKEGADASALDAGIADHVKERLDAGLLDLGLLIEPGDIAKYDFLRLGRLSSKGKSLDAGRVVGLLCLYGLYGHVLQSAVLVGCCRTSTSGGAGPGALGGEPEAVGLPAKPRRNDYGQLLCGLYGLPGCGAKLCRYFICSSSRNVESVEALHCPFHPIQPVGWSAECLGVAAYPAIYAGEPGAADGKRCGYHACEFPLPPLFYEIFYWHDFRGAVF